MTDPTPEMPLTRDRVNVVPWPPLLFAGAILAAVGLGRFASLPWPGLDDTPARVIGLAFGTAGLALAVWAIITLMRGGTTVMPHGKSTALITSGPYARFRNPIYLGEVLMLLGLAEASKNIWFAVAAFAFALLVTVLQILPDERHLSARFGSEYEFYKSRTRRWI